MHIHVILPTDSTLSPDQALSAIERYYPDAAIEVERRLATGIRVRAGDWRVEDDVRMILLAAAVAVEVA